MKLKRVYLVARRQAKTGQMPVGVDLALLTDLAFHFHWAAIRTWKSFHPDCWTFSSVLSSVLTG